MTTRGVSGGSIIKVKRIIHIPKDKTIFSLTIPESTRIIIKTAPITPVSLMKLKNRISAGLNLPLIIQGKREIKTTSGLMINMKIRAIKIPKRDVLIMIEIGTIAPKTTKITGFMRLFRK